VDRFTLRSVLRGVTCADRSLYLCGELFWHLRCSLSYGRTQRAMKPLSATEQARGGFTLVEAIVSTLIAGVVTAGLISTFMQAHWASEWSSYSLAAQSLAMQPIEQARGAKWDPYSSPVADQLVASNFPVRIEPLDIPISKTNVVYATNRTTIRTIRVSPPLKQITVECTWRFPKRGVFTNLITTYRAPDQ
jgi:type II secretory pathway pseudopilin PulG